MARNEEELYKSKNSSLCGVVDSQQDDEVPSGPLVC